MTRHDDTLRLRHILDHAREAMQLSSGKTRADLDTERLLNLGLTRLLEIVGKAAARASDEMRGRYPQIPWPQIVALRNRLIHGYDQVDLDILWTIIQSDLPPLVRELYKVLGETGASTQ